MVKIEIEGISSMTNEEKNKVVDEDIELFSKYMASLSDARSVGPLHPIEKAIVKTYIVWKSKSSII